MFSESRMRENRPSGLMRGGSLDLTSRDSCLLYLLTIGPPLTIGPETTKTGPILAPFIIDPFGSPLRLPSEGSPFLYRVRT
jgi:hypothetical protein